jgi:rRNA maturation RNase YbeY
MVPRLTERRKKKNWIKSVIAKEKKICGEINVVFTDDDSLRNKNIKYLKRDYYTDIITFDYTEGSRINGDLFISIDRIIENAEKFNESVEKEILRVMVHGVLHLIGYSDSTRDEKSRMSEKENKYILEYNSKV